MAQGIAKSTAPNTSKPPLGAKSAAPGPSKPLPAMPAQERRPPSPPCSAKTEVGISVEDYLVGGVAIFDAHIERGPIGEFFYRVWVFDETMVQGRRWATGCCPGTDGGWVGRCNDWGEGVFTRPMVQVLL
jgi:hypothetical protein